MLCRCGLSHNSNKVHQSCSCHSTDREPLLSPQQCRYTNSTATGQRKRFVRGNDNVCIKELWSLCEKFHFQRELTVYVCKTTFQILWRCSKGKKSEILACTMSILRIGEIYLIMSRIDGKLLHIYLHFNCHTPEIILSHYLLHFILGGGLKGKKKHLTLPFLANFAYLRVAA